MLRKTNSQKGFTIIEVVITIAIGAAVMALVLNAVAGARKSQRNNARAADVNQVAAGVNQYIATRNALPTTFADIAEIIDPSKFGHYDKTPSNSNDSINPANVDKSSGNVAGRFIDGSATGAVLTAPTALVAGTIWADETAAADKVAVYIKTGCASTTAAEAGGIREMAIIYRLEGQDSVICLEV